MPEAKFKNVLSLLRILRSAETKTIGDAFHLHFNLQVGSPSYLRAVASLRANVDEAALEILAEERLEQEGKDGLIQIIEQTKQALHPANTGNQIGQFYNNNLMIAVSQFSIASGYFSDTADLAFTGHPELDDLVTEMASVLGMIDASDLDSAHKAILTENIEALRMFLKNINIFGFDVAYSSYFDLVTRLRRQRDTGDEKMRGVVAGIWPQVERWAGRLAIIDEAYNHGASLLEHLSTAVSLLPPVG